MGRRVTQDFAARNVAAQEKTVLRSATGIPLGRKR
jgi:hypothetical protein